MTITHRFRRACRFDLDRAAEAFPDITHWMFSLMDDQGDSLGRIGKSVQFRNCTRELVKTLD